MTLLSFGDDAVRFEVRAGVDRRALLAVLRELPGVRDVVLTESIGAAYFEGGANASARLEAALAGEVTLLVPAPPRTHRVHAVYDGEDLDAVAATVGLSRAALVDLHASADYEVAMMGFLPGFAYLHGLDPRLAVPRRAPRTRVPAGAIGVAAGYTGIYPCASAGGWNLVARAIDFTAFDAAGATFAIGDLVRFEPTATATATASATASATATATATASASATASATAIAGLAVVVDGGRPGHMHEGVPPGGPLVRSAFVRANRAAGNDDEAAAIELAGSMTLTAQSDVVLADDDGTRTLLREGETFAVASRGTRVRYVAIGGGADAPRFLGSRCTLLAAGFGRALRRGDGVARASEPAAARPFDRTTTDDGSPIAVLAGPDAIRGALDGEFRIASSSDRTGTRLEGPPLDVAHALGRPSAPMTLGAIEATPSGLVVLGPDHPTTGGYPVVGVVAARDRDRFFARPLGAIVRFAHV